MSWVINIYFEQSIQDKKKNVCIDLNMKTFISVGPLGLVINIMGNVLGVCKHFQKKGKVKQIEI